MAKKQKCFILTMETKSKVFENVKTEIKSRDGDSIRIEVSNFLDKTILGGREISITIKEGEF